MTSSQDLAALEDDRFRFPRCIEFLQSRGAEIKRGDLWLDLGCHQGQLLRILTRQFGIQGMGFDDWDIAQKTPGPDDVWNYRTADLDRELPWTGPPVPFISALEVLEHMIDTDGFLHRIRDTLQPGGWVLISTPNINSLRNRITGIFGVYPAGLEYRTIIHHVRLYNVAKLREHLLASGFVDVAIRGISFLPTKFGMAQSGVSAALANAFPSLCPNIMAVARKPG